MERKPKIYGFNNGGSQGWYNACAIAEDGHGLCSHTCSTEGFMPGDLGMNGKDWSGKHKYYDAHYPQGWECEFVFSENIKSHAGLQAAFEKNKKLGDKGAVPQEAAPSVTVTFKDEDGKEHTETINL